MKHLSILTFQFYRLLMLYNIAFTVLVLFLSIFNLKSISAEAFLIVFLFAKIIGFISAVSLHCFSAKENYFYFRNAGYSMRKIFACSFAIDMSVCILFITLSKILLYAAAYLKG